MGKQQGFTVAFILSNFQKTPSQVVVEDGTRGSSGMGKWHGKVAWERSNVKDDTRGSSGMGKWHGKEATSKTIHEGVVAWESGMGKKQRQRRYTRE